MRHGAEKLGKLDARRDVYGDGSSPSSNADSFSIQHNPNSCSQGLACH